MKLGQSKDKGSDTSFELFIVDQSGIDLLDPNGLKSYKHENIKLYSDSTLQQEITKSVVNPLSTRLVNRMDYKGSFYDGKYFISILPPVIGKGTPTTLESNIFYLCLAKGVCDTIRTKIRIYDDNAELVDVIYNTFPVFENYKVVDPVEEDIHDKWIVIKK